MKSSSKIISNTVFILALLLSQAGLVYADSSGEAAGITEAKKLYAQALPMEVNSPKRAELLDQATKILLEVIEKDPKSLDAHRKLVGVYLLKQDYSNAIRTMQDAITLSPEDPKLFISLAFLYEHSGAFEYSLAMIDQALVLDPNQELAKEYRIIIQQKIEARNMEQLHDGKMEKGHGKPTGAAHPAVDPKN